MQITCSVLSIANYSMPSPQLGYCRYGSLLVFLIAPRSRGERANSIKVTKSNADITLLGFLPSMYLGYHPEPSSL